MDSGGSLVRRLAVPAVILAAAAGALAAWQFTAKPTAAPDRCGSDSPVFITGDGIGHVRIGQAVAALQATGCVVSDRYQLDSEAMQVRVLEVHVGRQTVTAEIDNGKVWRLAVDTPGLTTRHGLGIGTALSKLLQFPDPQGLIGDAGLFVVAPALCGLSFRLSHDPSGRELLWDWTPGDLAKLPPHTTIDTILVVGCAAR